MLELVDESDSKSGAVWRVSSSLTLRTKQSVTADTADIFLEMIKVHEGSTKSYLRSRKRFFKAAVLGLLPEAGQRPDDVDREQDTTTENTRRLAENCLIECGEVQAVHRT